MPPALDVDALPVEALPDADDAPPFPELVLLSPPPEPVSGPSSPHAARQNARAPTARRTALRAPGKPEKLRL
jgi:hypothetical protein